MILIPLLKNTYRGIETKEFFINNNKEKIKINELININNTNKLIIIADFSFCKMSIIEEILKMNVFHLRQTKDDKTLSYDIKKEHILIYFTAKRYITLCSFENKFLQDFENFDIAKELEDFDFNKKYSCAQDGKNSFLSDFGKIKDNPFRARKIFDKAFPQPKNENEFFYWKEAKKHISGFAYLKKPAIYKNLFSYDIKSSFPSRLYESIFPSGMGNELENFSALPLKKWYIKKIRIHSVKPKIYDFYGLYELYKQNLKTPFNIIITKETEESINECYNISYDIQKCYYYKIQKSIFDDFIFNNIHRKENEKKYIRKYSKAMNNTFIGSFGANDEFFSECFNLESDKIKITKNQTITEKKSYYPLYLYVNGLAKKEFINICIEHWDKIIYANTDGFFSTEQIDFRAYNAIKINRLGVVELRGFYDKVCFKAISNYYGTSIDVDGVVTEEIRLAGKKYNKITFDEFCNGFTAFGFGYSEYNFIQSFEVKEFGITEYIKFFEIDEQIRNEERLYKYYVKDRQEKTRLIEIREYEKKQKLISELYEYSEKLNNAKSFDEWATLKGYETISQDDINLIFGGL